MSQKNQSAIFPIRRALISVSDKNGVVDVAKGLEARKITMISTGGTASLLAKNGIAVTPIEKVTGIAEMMDGRVKTLNPKIHGGILARRDDKQHLSDMKAHGIEPIDLLVVNLYPFADALQDDKASRSDRVEMIDIGGPAMIRAAAKNHDFVTVITSSDDYATVLEEIDAVGGVSEKTRRRLAAKAFAHTAHYDAMIAAWLHEEKPVSPLTNTLTITGEAIKTMRYGENPHQQAGLYRMPSKTTRAGVLTAQQIQGKPLSYNNIYDADAAFELVAEFIAPSIAVIKHNNPCGVASGNDLTAIWHAARACDPDSAFGGIIGVNRRLTAEVAEAISEIFIEVIIAPDADEDAKKILATKPALRVLLTGEMPDPKAAGLMIRGISGGFLAQEKDNGFITESDLTYPTKRKPNDDEIADLLLAWRVAKHTKSNAIICARNQATIGIGAGQMSRIDSAQIAIRKARAMAKKSELSDLPLAGSAVASDAFFPFADGLIALAEAGANAVIQPGGSVRDDEVITAANNLGLAMVFTSMRHFRH